MWGHICVKQTGVWILIFWAIERGLTLKKREEDDNEDDDDAGEDDDTGQVTSIECSGVTRHSSTYELI